MAWPTAFLAVPPEDLSVDPDVAIESPKASNSDISRWMGNVPRIYEMLAQGATDVDFHRMATAPTSPAERELGETYRHLFSDSPSAQPLRAELDAGHLTVRSGQHRVRAAQNAAVPLIPVHVAARDEATLVEVRQDLEARAQTEHPEWVAIHRRYDEHARQETSRVQLERPDQPHRERSER